MYLFIPVLTNQRLKIMRPWSKCCCKKACIKKNIWSHKHCSWFSELGCDKGFTDDILISLTSGLERLLFPATGQSSSHSLRYRNVCKGCTSRLWHDGLILLTSAILLYFTQSCGFNMWASHTHAPAERLVLILSHQLFAAVRILKTWPLYALCINLIS